MGTWQITATGLPDFSPPRIVGAVPTARFYSCTATLGKRPMLAVSQRSRRKARLMFWTAGRPPFSLDQRFAKLMCAGGSGFEICNIFAENCAMDSMIRSMVR